MIINFRNLMCGGGGKEPVIEALSVTANGTYTVGEGVDGYSPVEVAVPIPTPKTEEKTVSIVSNGQTIVEKSASVDGMTKVTVDVNVARSAPIDFSVLGYTDENIGSIEIPLNRMGTIAEDIASSKEAWDRHPDGIFSNDTDLVYCPSGIEIIGAGSFSGCDNLSYIPDNVKYNGYPYYYNFSSTNLTKNPEVDWSKITVFDYSVSDNYYPNIREAHIGPLTNTEQPITIDPFKPSSTEPYLEKVVIEDGNYAEGSFVDLSLYMSKIPSLRHYENHISANKLYSYIGFEETDKLQTFIFDNWIESSISSFGNCSNLEVLELKNAKNISEWGCKWFNNSTKLRRLSVEDATGVSSLYGETITDTNYPNLEYLGLIDCTNISEIPFNFFGYSYNNEHTSLKYFGGFKNAKCDIDIRTLQHLNKESCQTIIENLYDFKGSGSQTITFSRYLTDKVSQEYIQKATDKGWTISFA